MLWKMLAKMCSENAKYVILFLSDETVGFGKCNGDYYEEKEDKNNNI